VSVAVEVKKECPQAPAVSPEEQRHREQRVLRVAKVLLVVNRPVLLVAKA
jgi:hypothetical protein